MRGSTNIGWGSWVAFGLSTALRRSFVLLLVASGCCAVAQTNWSSQYIKVDTILNFKMRHGEAGGRIVRASYGSSYAFTCHDVGYASDTIIVYKIDTKDYRIDTIKLYEKDICRKMKRNRYSGFSCMAMCESKLLLLYAKKIMVFRKVAGDGYRWWKTLDYPHHYDAVEMLNDSLALFSSKYYSWEPSTNLTVYDIDKGNVVSSVRPSVRSLYSTFWGGRHMVTAKGTRVAWLGPDNYTSTMYDSRLNILDSVSCNGDSWSFPPKVC